MDRVNGINAAHKKPLSFVIESAPWIVVVAEERVKRAKKAVEEAK